MSYLNIKKSDSHEAGKYYLIDDKISLKAKGLMSQLLAIPEDLDFTLESLTHLAQDGIKSIRSAANELETRGYLYRYQGRDKSGKLLPTEYTVYEMPQDTPKPTETSVDNFSDIDFDEFTFDNEENDFNFDHNSEPQQKDEYLQRALDLIFDVYHQLD